MHTPDHITESLETICWVKILKFFDVDADPGSVNLFDHGSGIRDGKNSDPGSGITRIHNTDQESQLRVHVHVLSSRKYGNNLPKTVVYIIIAETLQ
jgi:hypothetical protein